MCVGRGKAVRIDKTKEVHREKVNKRNIVTSNKDFN